MSIGPLATVPVDDSERLARFVLDKRWLPKGGEGVNARAVLAYKYVELSVSRHRDLAEGELWKLGEDVAKQRSEKEVRKIPLLGRADFFARTARQQNLDVRPDEPPRNHANVIGWPAEKSAQMSRAQEIAAQSVFIAHLPAQGTARCW